ncbi:hypothetical protein R1sor_006216 [Riccia sorocarpa]|uniref:RanBP2-type domain-containing protein n=1 Tax=Riccia sorocarpa TaxID=122646 RepID=A0ABD3HLS6_9MARC
MAQLPRCLQQASWKHVSGICAQTLRSFRCTEYSSLAAVGISCSSGSGSVLRPSQFSVVFIRSSHQKLSASPKTNLACGRLRIVPRRVPVLSTESLLSRNSRFGVPAVGSVLGRTFSSADESVLIDIDEKGTHKKDLLAEIEAKERELEELRNALKQVENERLVVNGNENEAGEDQVVPSSSAGLEDVDSGESSSDSSSEDVSSEDEEQEDIGEIDENAAVIHLGSGNETTVGSSAAEDVIDGSTVREPVEANTVGKSAGATEVGDTSPANAEPEESVSEHPWPQWTRFLKFLAKGNYFANEEGKEIDVSSISADDYGLVKRGCLNFGRERDDIFRSFAQKDLEIIARFGCPTTDRKVVNAGKRLREYLKIDEVSICKPCGLRASCERADFRVASDHVAGTPEVIRLLSQYAINVSPDSDREYKIPELVQTSCANLLQQAVTLGSKPRDPKLPKFEKKAEMVKSNRENRTERGIKKRGGDADGEMKPGDWKCPQCEFLNFARNRNCRECDARRPTPEMRPGDWLCPECDFLNFSRNRECHECKAERPPGVGYDAFKKDGRGDREGRRDGGSDRGERRYGRDRGEGRDFDRDTSRYESRGGGRERGRGSLNGSDRTRERVVDRRGRDDDEAESYNRSPRRDADRGVDRRSAGSNSQERGGRRNKYEEWKPDLSKKDEYDDEDEDFPVKSSNRKKIDDRFDDLDLDLDDDDDVEDVEAFGDNEFEDMRRVSSGGRSSSGSGDQRPGRSFDRDGPRWEDDRSSRSSARGRSRGGRKDDSNGDRDSWSSSSSSRGGRGSGRGAAGGRGRALGGRGRR